MQTIKRNYYIIALILMFFSTAVNLIWREKDWPGYFTMCSFIVLLILTIALKKDNDKNKK
jgi:cell division protein FtsW (lipid II flippase)